MDLICEVIFLIYELTKKEEIFKINFYDLFDDSFNIINSIYSYMARSVLSGDNI